MPTQTANLSEILSYAIILKRSLEADELTVLEDWRQFDTWQALAQHQREPLTIEWARIHACNDLARLMQPIYGHDIDRAQFVDLPKTVAKAVFALWETVWGNALALRQPSYERAVIQAVNELETALRKRKVNPRDKYCYMRMKKGDALKVIMTAVNQCKEWEPLETVQGVSQAAKCHAKNQGLQWPIHR